MFALHMARVLAYIDTRIILLYMVHTTAYSTARMLAPRVVAYEITGMVGLYMGRLIA
jgi:hypothetical protein